MSEPLQAITENTKPIYPFLGLYFVYLVHPNVLIHVCALKNSNYLHSRVDKPPDFCMYISFCRLYTHTETHPYPYPPIYSVRDTQLFADASQWPEYHCCDDLLNGKWYQA